MCAGKEIRIAALKAQNAQAALVIGEWQAVPATVAGARKVFLEFQPGLFAVRVNLIAALRNVDFLVRAGSPLQHLAQIAHRGVAGIHLSLAGDGANLHLAELFQRDGSAVVRDDLLRAVHDDLEDALQVQRGRDLLTHLDQRLQDLNFALGFEQAGVVQCASGGQRDGVQEEQVILAEWLPVEAVHGFQHANLEILRDDGNCHQRAD